MLPTAFASAVWLAACTGGTEAEGDDDVDDEASAGHEGSKGEGGESGTDDEGGNGGDNDERPPATSTPKLSVDLPDEETTVESTVELMAQVENDTNEDAKLTWKLEGLVENVHVSPAADGQSAVVRAALAGRYILSVQAEAGEHRASDSVALMFNAAPHRFEGSVHKGMGALAGVTMGLKWRVTDKVIKTVKTDGKGAFAFDGVIAPDQEIQILLAPR